MENKQIMQEFEEIEVLAAKLNAQIESLGKRLVELFPADHDCHLSGEDGCEDESHKGPELDLEQDGAGI